MPQHTAAASPRAAAALARSRAAADRKQQTGSQSPPASSRLPAAGSSPLASPRSTHSEAQFAPLGPVARRLRQQLQQQPTAAEADTELPAPWLADLPLAVPSIDAWPALLSELGAPLPAPLGSSFEFAPPRLPSPPSLQPVASPQASLRSATGDARGQMLAAQPLPTPAHESGTSSWAQLQLAMQRGGSSESGGSRGSSDAPQPGMQQVRPAAGAGTAGAGTTAAGPDGSGSITTTLETLSSSSRSATLQAAMARTYRRGSQDSSTDGGDGSTAARGFRRGSKDGSTNGDLPTNPSFEAAMARNFKRPSQDGGAPGAAATASGLAVFAPAHSASAAAAPAAVRSSEAAAPATAAAPVGGGAAAPAALQTSGSLPLLQVQGTEPGVPGHVAAVVATLSERSLRAMARAAAEAASPDGGGPAPSRGSGASPPLSPESVPDSATSTTVVVNGPTAASNIAGSPSAGGLPAADIGAGAGAKASAMFPRSSGGSGTPAPLSPTVRHVSFSDEVLAKTAADDDAGGGSPMAAAAAAWRAQDRALGPGSLAELRGADIVVNSNDVWPAVDIEAALAAQAAGARAAAACASPALPTGQPPRDVTPRKLNSGRFVFAASCW